MASVSLSFICFTDKGECIHTLPQSAGECTEGEIHTHLLSAGECDHTFLHLAGEYTLYTLPLSGISCHQLWNQYYSLCITFCERHQRECNILQSE